jgi:hypothetical protein
MTGLDEPRGIGEIVVREQFRQAARNRRSATRPQYQTKPTTEAVGLSLFAPQPRARREPGLSSTSTA